MKTVSVVLVSLALTMFFAAGALADTTDTYVYRTLLSPANEVPPVNSDASATVLVWLHVVRDDSGKITGGSVDFRADYKFSSQATITGFHIHPAPAGVNGPVAIDSGLSGTNSITTDASGVGTILRQTVISPSNAAQFAAFTGILNAPDQFYANIHTTTNPGGIMRAQLAPADVTVLRADLSPLNETPPITGLNASGSSSITVYASRDASGTITSGTVRFDVAFAFPGSINFTGTHIHAGAAGVAGPIVINPGVANFTSDTGSGSITAFADVPSTSTAGLAALEGLFKNPSGFYSNLHTSVNPGGAIRGPLQRTDTIVLRSVMSAANETPPIAGLTATGASKVTLYVARDGSGEIASGTAVFDTSVNGFPANTDFTGLHIHSGLAGVAGPVIISSGLSATNDVLSPSGSANVMRSVDVASSNANGVATLRGLLATPANYYINIHTTVNPGGAVRGQLALTGAPQMTLFLDPDFYVAETTTVPGQNGGAWGMITFANFLSGGYDGGGMFGPGGGTPGFGAFYLATAKTVTINISAQAVNGGGPSQIGVSLRDFNGNLIGSEVTATGLFSATQSLPPGFYVVVVRGIGPAAGAFQFSAGTDLLTAGGISGGYVTPVSAGFGAFNTGGSRQQVTIQAFSTALYGQFAAGNLTITLKDSKGNVIARTQ